MTTHSAPSVSVGLLRPTIASLAIVAVSVLALRLEGRVWTCAEGDFSPWISDIWSPHCSQHLLDPYSLTHFTHGLIFAGLFALLLPRVPRSWRFVGALALASCWEILENSAFIIDRYRSATMSLNYMGDSIINSLGDIACCGVGFWAALRLGWRRSILLYLAIELVLLVLIKDNLALNVLMLLWPIEAVRRWQAPG